MSGESMNRATVEQVSRRGFIGTVFSAGALILGTKILPIHALAADHAPSDIPIDRAAFHPNLFVGIETDGTVRIVAARSEMGTGIRTSLPMVLADELGADWSKVKVQQGLGNAAYGSQDTDGSQSITDFYDGMRQIGATARLMLERAAAAKWGVPVSECQAQSHFVNHTPDGRKIGFGELAALAAQQPIPKPAELRLKDASEFRYIGKGVPIVDLDDIVTGQSIFGMDISLPGMVYASIERPPVLGGKVRSYDDTEAKKVTGVIGTATIETFKAPHEFQPLGGVAVIATNTWAATQGRKKLKIDWELGPNAIYDSTSFRKSMIEASQKPQKLLREVGNVDGEFSKGGKVVESQYYTPLLAHVPMEPPVATALYKDGKVEIWTSTQNPQAVQSSAAKYLGLKAEDITCHVPLLGGGFGRKSKPDYSTEAAYLSKQLGKPVKVVWSREDDVHFDYFHTTSAMYFKAQVDDKGMPVAWLQRSVFPPIGSTFDPTAEYGVDECNMGFTDIPFDLKNLRVENGPAKAHVRIGWMRSVANIYHAYGVEGFTDELAHAAGRDPIEYWLELLGPDRLITFDGEHAKYENYGKPMAKYPLDTSRLRKVAQLAAEQSGWKTKRAQGKKLGFAAHRSFLTYVAAVVEVEVDSKGKLTIPRIDLAVDCGQVIHPDRVKAQFEGAAVFGVSVALLGEITASDGRINQSNFNNYKIARMSDAPRETYVHLASGSNLPTGVGEPGVPPVAPAICNAIFAATGKRIRELPVSKTRLV
jgi:isoquinoline 1-oxidoreductase subunit beta